MSGKAKAPIQGYKQGRLCAVKGASGTPSEQDLAAINGYALVALTAEDVYVRRMVLAHNAIDRDHEVFDDALLDDFARTLPGKGLFVKHPGGWDGDSGPGEGRFFSAQVVEMPIEEARAVLREPGLQFAPGATRARLLEAGFYMVRTEGNADLIRKINAGIAGDVSIGFRAADRHAIKDASGNTIAYRLLGPGEALEGSLVWLGAQPGARIHKSAKPNREDPTVDEDDDIKALKAQHNLLAEQLKAAQPKAAAYDALKAAMGELADDPQALAQAVNDGKRYRQGLIDDIVAMERAQGLIKGDDEATVTAAKALYAGADIAILKARAEALRAKTAGGAGSSGGDPNATGAQPQPGGDKAADPFNPLANPALMG